MQCTRKLPEFAEITQNNAFMPFKVIQGRGAGTVSGQDGQRFLEKIWHEAPKFFFKFAHPGF